jgi:hypothetical protein
VAVSLQSSPVKEEGSIGFATPQSPLKKRDGDKTRTGGNKLTGTSLDGTIHGEGEKLKLWQREGSLRKRIGWRELGRRRTPILLPSQGEGAAELVGTGVISGGFLEPK